MAEPEKTQKKKPGRKKRRRKEATAADIRTGTGQFRHLDELAKMPDDPRFATKALSDPSRFPLWLVAGLAGLNLALMLGLWLLAALDPQPNHYLVLGEELYRSQSDSAPQALQKVQTPINTDEAIQAWATARAVEMYSFNFSNYVDRLEALAPYFRPSTHRGVKNAFLRSPIGQNMQQSTTQFPYIFTAAPAGPAIVTNRILIEGRRKWRVEVPLIIEIRRLGAATQRPGRLITFDIVELDTRQNPRGLIIENVLLAPLNPRSILLEGG